MKKLCILGVLAALWILPGVCVAQATTVTFDSDGGILVDGEPFFPRSLYGVTYPSYMSQLMTATSAAGVNCWLSPWADNARLSDLMDLAHANGIMVVPFVSDSAFLNGDYESDPVAKSAALATMMERVALFKDHPALLGWDTGNESMDHGALPALVAELTDAIHLEDPNHPVFFLPTYKWYEPSIWQSVSNACDAFLMDVYPVWDASDTDHSDADSAMNVIDYSLEGNRLWAITQAFNWDDFRPGNGYRYPTAHELRFLAFLPVIRGANGLTWYFEADRYASAPDPFSDEPGFWDKIMAQVAEVTLVSDAIVAPKITEGIAVTESSPGLRWAVRELDDDGYMVFVANFEDQPVSVGTITMDFISGGNAIEKIISQETEMSLVGKTVSVIDMQPYDVAVFKLSDALASKITYVGAEIDGGAAEAWKTDTVAKSYDVDGNNIYGEYGALQFGVVGIFSDETIIYHSSGPQVAGAAGDVLMDKADAPATDTVSGTATGWFKFMVGSNAPPTIRLGIMQDILSAGEAAGDTPITLYVTNERDMVQATAVTVQGNHQADIYFFDIVGALPGDIIAIGTSTRSGGNPSYVGPVMWDVWQSTITYVGAEIDGGVAEAWKTDTVAKSYDLDDDNVYGEYAAVQFGVVGVFSPATIEYHSSGPQVAGVAGDVLMDKADAPASDTVSGTATGWFKFQIGANAPSTIRLGIMQDVLSAGEAAGDTPITLYVTNERDLVQATAVTVQGNHQADIYFFDIRGALPGDVIVIGTSTRSGGNPSYVGPAMWDASSEAPPAIIGSLNHFSSNVVEMVVDYCPDPLTSYPRKSTDLVGGVWSNVAHSTSGISGTFVETNLSYSAASGSAKAIYLEATDPAAFFRIESE